MVNIDKQDTYNKIVALVAQKLNVDKAAVEKAQSFQDLGADSLDMVEIVMKIEEDFGVEINDADAEKLTSISQAVDYVYALRSKNNN